MVPEQEGQIPEAGEAANKSVSPTILLERGNDAKHLSAPTTSAAATTTTATAAANSSAHFRFAVSERPAAIPTEFQWNNGSSGSSSRAVSNATSNVCLSPVSELDVQCCGRKWKRQYGQCSATDEWQLSQYFTVDASAVGQCHFRRLSDDTTELQWGHRKWRVELVLQLSDDEPVERCVPLRRCFRQ